VNLQEFYQEKLQLAQTDRDHLRRKDRLLSASRLIAGTSMLLSLYFLLLNGKAFLAAVFLVSLIGFVALVVVHARLRKQISLNGRFIEVINEEISYLNNDLSLFSDGAEFKDPSHLYAEDLDVFGRGSLFQRIGRVASEEAKQRLASRLKDNEAEIDLDYQQAVKELTPISEWRFRFRALSKGLTIGDLHRRIEQWKANPLTDSWLLFPMVSWLLSAVFPISVLLILIFQRYDMIDWLLLPFILNLFLFSRILKDLKRDQAFVDQISSDLRAHQALLEMILDQQWSSRILSGIQSQLKAKDTDAVEITGQFSRLVSQLDSLNNMFGASLFNGMFLFHLHVYRSLLDWKKSHVHDLSLWLDAQAEMEVWVGMASFAFNHPEFVYSVLSEAQGFKAEGIGHPFIHESKRVTNDLAFDGFKLVILTGSNMAGKSTFLRSLGVNIILARLGLPVCAKAMTLSQIQLLTSMKPQDSLNDNQSYFQAEIERLRTLVDQLDTGRFSFLLLDEILRGTNSEDKRNGTVGFLEKIHSKNLIGLIATHDIEIAELTAENPEVYSNKYFESYQRDRDLVFDYVLRDGVCHTPNATQLMKQKGII